VEGNELKHEVGCSLKSGFLWAYLSHYNIQVAYNRRKQNRTAWSFNVV